MISCLVIDKNNVKRYNEGGTNKNREGTELMKPKLLATLPSLSNMKSVERIVMHPNIDEVRLNTGARFPGKPEDVLKNLEEMCDYYGKKLWIDIKGRQLRIEKWADPVYESIELNHRIDPSAKGKACLFRNGGTSVIQHVDNSGPNSRIFVYPLPEEALGAGQSINIIGDYSVNGYLTDRDKEFLYLAEKLGIKNVMASFVESYTDIMEVLSCIHDADIVIKIESVKGVEFLKSSMKSLKGKIENGSIQVMAARDDLYLQMQQFGNERPMAMMDSLWTIIHADKNAICASRIFQSLEKRHGNISFSDMEDLILMWHMGYRRFMLCDNVCNYAFDKAMDGWDSFVRMYDDSDKNKSEGGD